MISRMLLPMGGTGREPPVKLSEKTPIASTGGAESGALQDETEAVDPDLAAIAEAWPMLPEAIRAGIMAMVRTAAGK